MTEKKYLVDYEISHCDSKVISVEGDESEYKVVLKASIFHPQGGGQATDKGKIFNKDKSIVFNVKKAVPSKKDRNTIEHLGIFESEKKFSEGDEVKCELDMENRKLHTYLHSAGHLLDCAVRNIGFDNWRPSKGYHFPNGSYVEYEMKDKKIEDRKKFMSDIKEEIERICEKNEKIEFLMVEYKELGKYFDNGVIPSYLPKQPIRIIGYSGIYHPCEGTHIKETGVLKNKINIRKLKISKGKIKVSYTVSK